MGLGVGLGRWAYGLASVEKANDIYEEPNNTSNMLVTLKKPRCTQVKVRRGNSNVFLTSKSALFVIEIGDAMISTLTSASLLFLKN